MTGIGKMMITTVKDELLRQIYYDARHPAGFASVSKLYDAVKKEGFSKNDVRKWLAGQLTYTLHKPKRVKFKRNPTVVTGIDAQWQADLVDMRLLSRANNGNKYLLTVIDVFSKFAFAMPVKGKTGKVIADAFSKIFKHRTPNALQTDQGREFTNQKVAKVLTDNNVTFFTTRNTEIKCAVVERFNRTLRGRMFKYFTSKGTKRYVDVLHHLVDGYNNAVHRSIGMPPASVTSAHTTIIFKRLYGVDDERQLLRKRHGTPKVSVGSMVRVPYENKPFDQAYYPRWTDEVYTVTGAVKDYKKPQYKLTDIDNKTLQGRFYPEEIQLVSSNPTYRLEKVLKRRTIAGVKQSFVKWLNYDSKHNCWINDASIEDVA